MFLREALSEAIGIRLGIPRKVELDKNKSIQLIT